MSSTHDPPHLQTTPSVRQPRVPSHFSLVGGDLGSFEQLSDPAQVHALRHSIRLAKRIFFSKRSIKITNVALATQTEAIVPEGATLPQPKEWVGASFDRQVLVKQMELERAVDVKFIAHCSTPHYAFCHSRFAPNTIYINYDTIVAAGEAYKIRDAEPRAYESHILFLAMVITHELQHVIRAYVSQIRLVTMAGDPLMCCRTGEGGLWYEHQLYGGEVEALVYADGESCASFPGQIKNVTVCCLGPEGPYSFLLNAATITTVVAGESNWEQTIPFAPDPTLAITPGRIDGLSLKTWAIMTPLFQYSSRPWHPLGSDGSDPAPTHEPESKTVPISRDSTLSHRSYAEDDDSDELVMYGPRPNDDMEAYIKRLESLGAKEPKRTRHDPSLVNYLSSPHISTKCGTNMIEDARREDFPHVTQEQWDKLQRQGEN